MSKEEFYRRAEASEECVVDWEQGEAVILSPGHGRHGLFIARLFNVLEGSLRGSGALIRPEVFVDFGERTYGADLVVLLPQHVDRYRDGRVYGVPDLVVEVLSEDSHLRDRVAKFEVYHRQGVTWYWIGDPALGLLEEFHHSPEGYLRTAAGDRDHPFQPRGFPGLSIQVAELMEDPPSAHHHPDRRGGEVRSSPSLGHQIDLVIPGGQGPAGREGGSPGPGVCRPRAR